MEGDRRSSVDQPAKQMPDMTTVTLRMTHLKLHASGVFSNVYRGTLHLPDGKTKQVAIKKTWPESSDRNFEMIFLTGVDRRSHKNIIQMLYAFSNTTKDGRICESFVFEYMPDTLQSILKQQALDVTDVKLYTWQIFYGLKYLAADNIVHRDIKPVNILIDHSNGHLQISDFGSAKVIRSGQPSTAYQVTRFYRPPDLLLGSMHYDCAVDIWSAGCVFGEMIKRHVLFPGRDTKHQLKLIIAALGVPSEGDVRAMRCPTRLEVDEVVTATGLQAVIPDADASTVLLLNKILAYNPKERYRGAALLSNPYFEVITKSVGGDGIRSNGQKIALIVSPDDVKDAISDNRHVKPKRTIMDRRVEITFSNDNKQLEKTNSRTKIKVTSKEKLAQPRILATESNSNIHSKPNGQSPDSQKGRVTADGRNSREHSRISKISSRKSSKAEIKERKS